MYQPAVVITGANSNLGRALARVAVLEGSALVLVDEPGCNLALTEFELYGVAAAAIEIDLTAPDAFDCLQKALYQRNLYCDVLVNCAAIAAVGAMSKIGRQRQIKLINVNVRALTHMTLGFIPAMVARGHGGILNVGSITGFPVSSQLAVYYASKAYVNAFSAALARELRGTGVTVTCVAAGLIAESFQRWASEPSLSLLPQSTASDTAVSAWLGFKTGQRMVVPALANPLAASMGKWLPPHLAQRLVEPLQPRA